MSGIKTFNKKSRKGISPVIATVILVAVAVVIAAALAGFSSSLFGTYSSAGAAVTVKSVAMDVDGNVDLELVNSGNVADELVSVSTVGFAPDTTPSAAAGSTLIMTPNGGTSVSTSKLGGVATAIFDEGQIVTVKVNLKSGAQLTQSVVIVP